MAEKKPKNVRAMSQQRFQQEVARELGIDLGNESESVSPKKIDDMEKTLHADNDDDSEADSPNNAQ